jgi:hypothetical protein
VDDDDADPIDSEALIVEIVRYLAAVDTLPGQALRADVAA